VVARGDQSSNECRIRVPCLVRRYAPYILAQPNNEHTLLVVHGGVKSKEWYPGSYRFRRAGPVHSSMLRVLHFRPDRRTEFAVCLHALASRGACPQQIRGFPAGTPSVHAAAHTVLTATPPMSRSCERRPARCAMLHAYQDTASKIRQRSLSERITQLLGTVPYLSAEASPLHERQHMRRRRSRIRALPPHPDVSSRDRVFHSADGARAQSKSNFADFVQSVQLCGFRAWGYLTPRSAAPEEPNG